MQEQVRAATQDTLGKAPSSSYRGWGAVPWSAGLGQTAGLGSVLGGICNHGGSSRFAQQQVATCPWSTRYLVLGAARLGGMKLWSESALSRAYFFFSEN